MVPRGTVGSLREVPGREAGRMNTVVLFCQVSEASWPGIDKLAHAQTEGQARKQD